MFKEEKVKISKKTLDLPEILCYTVKCSKDYKSLKGEKT